MKVSWNWLRQLVDLTSITCLELADKLTLAGFEIENIQYNKQIQDTTFEISITANRQDTLYMMGLAREIAVILRVNLLNKTQELLSNEIEYTSIENKESVYELCYNTISNIQSTTSPLWLQSYLVASDIQPSYTLIDIVEFINLKWGQDIQVFDIARLDNKYFDITQIDIKRNNQYQQVVNQVTNTSKNNVQPIALNYKNNPLALIGIASSPDSYCQQETESILLYSAICSPQYIKNMTSQLNIQTDISKKHIRGISRSNFDHAYQEINQMIKALCHGNLGPREKYQKLVRQLNSFEVDISNIYKTLGPIKQQESAIRKHLSQEHIITILDTLNFQPIFNKKNNVVEVTIPEYREIDVCREIDVIEEIGRIHGFNNFSDILPRYTRQGSFSKEFITITKIRSILRDIGLNEVVHYSLSQYTSNQTNSIKLHNPLVEEQATLCTNLIEHLIQAKSFNSKQGNQPLEAFEIGRIFKGDSVSLNKTETICVAGIMGRENYSRSSWAEKPHFLNWFQAKGNLEELFERLHARVQWSENKTLSAWGQRIIKYFHPKRFIMILNQEEEIGIFGEINIRTANKFDIQEKTYVFEIDIDKLSSTITQHNHLNYLAAKQSSYPSVTRDLSIAAHKKIPVSIIINKIRKESGPFIKSIEIFNEYIDEDSQQKARNLGLRLTYESEEKTLDQTDILNIDQRIEKLKINDFIMTE